MLSKPDETDIISEASMEGRMPNLNSKSIAAFIILILLAIQAPLFSQAGERFFDTAPAAHKDIRLTVFYPSIGSIKAVAALRKYSCLDVPDLVVIGVFHEKEATKYAESLQYVKDNGLDWFRFHSVSAEIGEDVLFKKNACTPEYEKIFKGSDGIIFFGGPDIPPSIYKEKTNLLSVIEDPVRHDFELSAIFHLLGGLQDPAFKALLDGRPGFPALGICLGCQSLNVGTGGTLIQDIWSEVYGKPDVEDILALDPEQWHNNPYILLHPQEKLIGYNFHRIRLEGKGLFCSDMGFRTDDHPRILSSHHQALEKLGKGLKVIATSMDGKIVEAVAHEKYPNVLGVQFHPEHRMLWEDEAQFKQSPKDALFSFKGLLEGTPPSFAFNKGIWQWLSRKLTEGRR
jgi:putative glutamine amidotransferase